MQRKPGVAVTLLTPGATVNRWPSAGGAARATLGPSGSQCKRHLGSATGIQRGAAIASTRRAHWMRNVPHAVAAAPLPAAAASTRRTGANNLHRVLDAGAFVTATAKVRRVLVFGLGGGGGGEAVYVCVSKLGGAPTEAGPDI